MNVGSVWKDHLSIGRLAELACLLEVTASKPGNVHRGADFEDVGFTDFAASAVAMGQAIDDSRARSYGETVLSVARQTLCVADSNTNLGMNLLISLLAKAGEISNELSAGSVGRVLSDLDASDASNVYEAIGLMNPGGMGEVSEHDVHGSAPQSLLESMELAKDRDLIARQFTNGFADVFEKSLPWILEGRAKFGNLMQGIVWAHVRLMSEHADSLIERKCGVLVAEQSQAMAARAIEAVTAGPAAFFSSVSNLDFWLRSDGHRRNPGTTADMVAAGLFVGLYNDEITPPFSS